MQIENLNKDLDTKEMTEVRGGENGNSAVNTIGQLTNLTVPVGVLSGGPSNTSVSVDSTQNAKIWNEQEAGDSFEALLPAVAEPLSVRQPRQSLEGTSILVADDNATNFVLREVDFVAHTVTSHASASPRTRNGGYSTCRHNQPSPVFPARPTAHSASHTSRNGRTTITASTRIGSRIATVRQPSPAPPCPGAAPFASMARA